MDQPDDQERVTTMVQEFRLKLEFWGEALEMAVYLINLPSSRV